MGLWKLLTRWHDKVWRIISGAKVTHKHVNVPGTASTATTSDLRTQGSPKVASNGEKNNRKVLEQRVMWSEPEKVRKIISSTLKHLKQDGEKGVGKIIRGGNTSLPDTRQRDVPGALGDNSKNSEQRPAEVAPPINKIVLIKALTEKYGEKKELATTSGSLPTTSPEKRMATSGPIEATKYQTGDKPVLHAPLNKRRTIAEIEEREKLSHSAPQISC